MKSKQWQKHVDAFNKSELSKKEYSVKYQLVYHQFLYWFENLNRASATDFIPVIVPVEVKDTPIPSLKNVSTTLGVIEFPNGARLIIQSPDLLPLLPSLLIGGNHAATL
jgi:hypothetical protein